MGNICLILSNHDDRENWLYPQGNAVLGWILQQGIHSYPLPEDHRPGMFKSIHNFKDIPKTISEAMCLGYMVP